MSLKSYIFLMLLATVACYLALLSVVFYFDPFAGGFWVMIFFYASLILSLVGTFAILGLVLRMIFTSDKLIFRKVITSFRQALWFSLLISICFLLQSLGLLVWLNILILIIAFALLELFFISYKSKVKSRI